MNQSGGLKGNLGSWQREPQTEPIWARPQTAIVSCQPSETEAGKSRHSVRGLIHRRAAEDGINVINQEKGLTIMHAVYRITYMQ